MIIIYLLYDVLSYVVMVFLVEVDVVIVGVGIMGCVVVYYFGLCGLKVVVFDKLCIVG